MGKFKIFLFFLFCALFFVRPAIAAEPKQAVVVNPIRGNDFWSYSYSTLDTPTKQYKIIKDNGLTATWLVRYDALKDPKVVQFLKSLDSSQEIGIFMEVTPSLTTDAKVTYNQSASWHNAKSILLVGYSPEDRKKLIDTVMAKYQSVFNTTPKSVGAWWIDANSLTYLHDTYHVEANLDVADQFSTDQYQVWGQYFSVPFYPAKQNALMPAQSPEQKIGVVTMQWATRDPFNAYGYGEFESTYSVQANDYMLHDLDINYFKKLVAIYPQVTVGLENDFDFQKYGDEYEKQIELLRTQNIPVKTMFHYATDYKVQNPNISPPVLIYAADPLGSDGEVIWYMNPKYRVGWFYGTYGSTIRDLRMYSDSSTEPCFNKACDNLNLAPSFISLIDDANLRNRWVLDEGELTALQVQQQNDQVTVQYYIGQTKRTLKFLPNDIQVDNTVKTLQAAILDANKVTEQQQKAQANGQFHSVLKTNLFSEITDFSKFAIFSILFFLIPGYMICRRFLFAIPVGWTLFTLLSYILGFFDLQILLYGLPLVAALGFFDIGAPKIPKIIFSFRQIILLVLVFIGSATWLATTVKNGLEYNYGLGFWGPNGHDAIWHLALIGELQKNVPPDNPIFSDTALSNYHYFYDLLVAQSANLFHLQTIDLLFRFFPIFIALLSGFLLFQVTEKLSRDIFKFSSKMSFWSGFFATFFMYFGGGFGWIISFIKERTFGGESMFWAQPAISTLLNPPFAISIIFLLTGLYFLLVREHESLKAKERWTNFITIFLVWGTLVEFKAYGGVLVLGAFGLYTLEKLIVKKNFSFLPLLISTGALALVVFLPNNSESTSLLVFSPFWLVSTMISFPDRLGWQRLALALDSKVLYKQFLALLIGTIIFLGGNMGMRIISLASIKDFFRQRILFWVFILGIIASLLFIQTGTNWNTIQFFYYSLLIINIFAGVAIARIAQKIGLKGGLIIFAVLAVLTIPTTLNSLNQFLPSRPPAMLSSKEFEALSFLQKQNDGTVLTPAFDENMRPQFVEPVPLFAYASTGYVSAFSGHTTFLEDTENLDILGVDYKERLNVQRDFFRNLDRSQQILKNNKIFYVYLPKKYGFSINESKMGVKKIFENEEVEVYKATN